MKALTSFKLCLTMLVMSFAVNSVGQEQEYVAYYEAKYPISLVSYHRLSLLGDPAVSLKTLNAFNNIFKNATDARWFAVENKFLVKFNDQGRNTRALFDQNGVMIYSIANGTEKDLPKEIRKLVKSYYYDYEIFLTQEFHSFNRMAWLIHLEDEDCIVNAKIVDGEMEETERLEKSN